MRRGAPAACLLVVLPILLPALPSHAATLRVPADYPTIPGGLAASVSGDTVLVAAGTYSDVETQGGATSCAFLVGGAYLVSESGPEVTIIDMKGAGGPSPDVVRATVSAEPMWIEGFTVTGAPYGGTGIVGLQIPKLTVKDCIVRDLDAGIFDGGGIGASRIDLDVIDCQFLRCRGDYGAGLGLAQCGVRVIGSTFEDCELNALYQYSGDIFVYDESLVVENCRFVNNHSEIGGAIVEVMRGDVSISGCWFEENAATDVAGAVYLGGISGSRTIEDCVFVMNEASSIAGPGGALRIHHATNIRGCTFYGNRQSWDYGGGAAIYIDGGASTLENCIVANSHQGAAIRVEPMSGSSLASTCNDFWENEDGNGDNWTPDPTDFEADPLFCDPENGSFELSSWSPCLPANSPFGCGLIGALGEGCGTISIEETSWGRIKSLYLGEKGGER